MKYTEKELMKARERLFGLVMKIEDSPYKKEMSNTQDALKIGMNVIAERLLEMRGA